MDGQTLAVAIAIMKSYPDSAAASAEAAAASADEALGYAEDAQEAADSVTPATAQETLTYVFGGGDE